MFTNILANFFVKKITAFSIAKDLNLTNKEEEVTTGTEVSEYLNKDKKEFDKFVKSKCIFTRVTPLQKLEIIESFYKPRILLRNLCFIIGIIVGICLSIIIISFLFNSYERYLTSYFLGLSIGGTILLIKKNRGFDLKGIVILLTGLVVSILPLLFNVSTNNNGNLFFISVGGFLSSLAFIMPGISGSMLLLVLGVYDIIIISMSDIFNFYINGMNYNSLIICIVFGFSFFIGAVFFSKIIKKLIRDYKQIFLTISLGLLIGMLCVMSFDILQSNINSFLMILISCIGIITIKFFGE